MELALTGSAVWLIFLSGIAAVTSAVLILLLRPVLQRYALARPNARSSHTIPTPQGGGIAVIAGTVIAIGLAAYLYPGAQIEPFRLTVVIATAILLAVLGGFDDIKTLEIIPRLIVQAIAVAAVILVLPDGLRVISVLPWWLERGLLFIGGIWFVNLVNFMDGIDWMTVAEVVPITAGLAILGLMGALPFDATLTAFALCGAMAGFAPFNRPVAKLFLGDVGSLPVGLLIAWMLMLLAGSGNVAAALLLPLYYVADATITLFRRLFKGEPMTSAHRDHFYQRATAGGYTVPDVIARVFAVNLALVALAIVTVIISGTGIAIAALLLGLGAVIWLLVTFSREKITAA